MTARRYPIAPGRWRIIKGLAYGYCSDGRPIDTDGRWPMTMWCTCPTCAVQGARVAPRGRR
jgi:hypothetical protein